MPNFYIIAGCNGAGKTTASRTILPELLKCKEFVNADEIAKGISPFNSDAVSFEAGRIMLSRIRELSDQKVDFAIETTLSTKSYGKLIRDLKKKGYRISLLFFWLSSVKLAKERVKERVNKGGHGIPQDVIVRRYKKGLFNLREIFLPLVDDWLVYDNSLLEETLIAKKLGTKSIKILDSKKFKQVLKK